MEPDETFFEGSVRFSIFTTNLSLDSSAEDTSQELDDTFSSPNSSPGELYQYYAEFTAAQSPPGYFALSQTVDNAGAAELTERMRI